MYNNPKSLCKEVMAFFVLYINAYMCLYTNRAHIHVSCVGFVSVMRFIDIIN